MKWENGEKGREREEKRKAWWSSLAVHTLSSLPRATKEGGNNSPVSLGGCLYLYRDSHCGHTVYEPSQVSVV